MASRLRMPTLAITTLSMALTLASIGTAGRSLHVYNHQHKSDPWLLPLWPHHFDSRELQMLIGTPAAVFVLNAILAVALLVSALPANLIVVTSSFLSTLVMVVSIAFSTIINKRAPYGDTLQTWTCRWSGISILDGEGPPDQFHTLCHETRFAYYTTIPLLVIQVILFAVGVYAVFASPPPHKHQQIEKQQDHQLRDVSNVRDVTYETKTENPKMYEDNAGVYGVAKELPPTPQFQFKNADSNERTPRSSLMEAVLRKAE